MRKKIKNKNIKLFNSYFVHYFPYTKDEKNAKVFFYTIYTNFHNFTLIFKI